MLKEWCKYRYGIFPENGFTGDSLYPTTYQEGNTTLASQGCLQQDILCPLGKEHALKKIGPIHAKHLVPYRVKLPQLCNFTKFWFLRIHYII